MKIINIDINLGKPVKEISDISPLKKMFINRYNNNINTKKSNKTSVSTNKREKRKKKSKTKKLSLPRKKYLEEGYDNILTKNIEDELDDFLINKKNNSYDNKSNNKKINLNNIYTVNNNYFRTFINEDNIRDNDNGKIKVITKNEVKKKEYKNILVKNIITKDKRLFIHINYIFCFSSKNYLNNSKNKYTYNNHCLITKRNKSFSFIMQKPNTKQKNNILIKNISFKENEVKNKSNTKSNNKDKYLFSCLKFIIKNINKVFLKKAFSYFLKNLDIM